MPVGSATRGTWAIIGTPWQNQWHQHVNKQGSRLIWADFFECMSEAEVEVKSTIFLLLITFDLIHQVIRAFAHVCQLEPDLLV